MRCRLEENTIKYDILEDLRNCFWGYKSFLSFLEKIANGCVMESVLLDKTLIGHEAISEFFKKEEEKIKSEEYECCKIGFIEYVDGFSPRLCILLEDYQDGMDLIVDIEIDDDGLVDKLIFSDAAQLKYTNWDDFVCLNPSSKEDDTYWWEEEEDDEDDDLNHLIRIGEKYRNEFHLFLSCMNKEFNNEISLQISMKDWLEFLDNWKRYISFQTFDEAFENMAGVDYDNNIVNKPEIAKRLGRIGKELWKNKENSKCMLECLLEWTELYKDSYLFIDIYFAELF